MKGFKNRWLVALCVLTLVIGMVGAVNAATPQQGQNSKWSVESMIKGDSAKMPMNTYMNTAVTGGSNSQPQTDSPQPEESSAGTEATGSPQSSGTGNTSGQNTAPQKQNEFYSQMLDQMNQAMNDHAMPGHMDNMTQGDFEAMKQAHRQYHLQGQDEPQFPGKSNGNGPGYGNMMSGN
ncbi:MAG: hypothetical protein ACOY30_02950 [Bacillota bacterium]